VLGNLVSYSRAEGMRPAPVRHFQDHGLNSLFFFSEDRESVQAVVPLLLRSEEPPTALVRRFCSVSEVSLDAQPLYLSLHAASCLRDIATGKTTDAIDGVESPQDRTPEDLAAIIQRRRSTRVFTGRRLPRSVLSTILNRAYSSFRLHLLGATRAREYLCPELLESYVVVQSVAALEPGIYHYEAISGGLELSTRGDLRSPMRRACLGQELARDASALVIHVADLTTALGAWGDRVYRDLHVDAGILGQQLNLEAIALGQGVSGIGGFLDDELSSLLGLSSRYGVIYVTVLGCPA